MLDSLRKVGKEIGRELNRTWENLSDGWRELLSRSSNALTHFTKKHEDNQGGEISLSQFPSWSLLAGEVVETDESIIVRLEVPGMEKEDCNITIEGNTLYLTGEKRISRESEEGQYHIMERAYGSFQRAIPLAHNVDSEKAEASYKNGVLSVRLPKTGSATSKSIVIN
ncbi:Hsp20/alpha crystallin family protein [Sulfurirhabdus autotrophica]|uniref:Heat shock protein Hsp20 n=1 Tax=Sulfurirhabdus autotrophica TaxID=1706046 RepID=A0A4R3YE08_9PROT|nr:Hsp20/alpha crystallin family protein [Sulfurirhabdus autotrophica]TCV90141.1 heat shock protein Hsp20 [Sulfurirhabdus autotrophica]